MKKCTNNASIAEYVYDYNGNRMVKKNYLNGNLSTTITSWSDSYETKVVAGGSTENTAYYWVNGQLISKKDNAGTRTYMHNDHLGSNAVVTNSSGTVLERTKYDPWGEVLSGGTKSKFLYTGQEADTETKLHYYNARYYDPHLRRFTQPDPYIQNVYNPQSLNRYSYAFNNPLKYTDPTGNFNVFGAIADAAKAAANAVANAAKAAANALANAGRAVAAAIAPKPSVQYIAPPKNTGSVSGLSTSLPGLGSQTSGVTTTVSAAEIELQRNISPLPFTKETLKQNVLEASRRPVSLTPQGIGNAFWFYNNVKPGGPMDYKVGTLGTLKANEAAGNVNFGAVGRAQGWNLYTLQQGAGIAQKFGQAKDRLEQLFDPTQPLRGSDGLLLLIPPYWDENKDFQNINDGYYGASVWQQ